jgi:hypothetical protein
VLEGSIAVALLAAAAYGVTHIPPFPSLDFFATGRTHLDPIPIDRERACSHVEAIHAQLDQFQDAYIAATFGLDQQSFDALTAGRGTPGSSTTTPQAFDPARWPLVKTQLDGDAQQLDVAIASGIPSFPPRVQRELRTVRDVLARGRVRLIGTHDAAEMHQRAHGLFEQGQTHVGWAGDLVGRQCPVPLGATGSPLEPGPD